MGSLQSIFRSQLVFDEQRSLFDYWQSKCNENCLPGRADLQPVDFPKLLPLVSLIDVCGDDVRHEYRIRLAGTGLRAHHNRETTGKMLDDLYSQETCEYWHRILDVLVARERPACGATGPGDTANSHYAQFWMRLPLVDATGRVNMILAYDVFTPLSALSASNRAMIANC